MPRPVSVKKVSLSGHVKVYPNPANDEFNIEGVEAGSTVYLYDVNGKLMMQEKVMNKSNVAWNISHLASGNYLLKVKDKNGAEGTAKVVKE